MKFLLLVFCLVCLGSADKFAVLVSGSYGYWNYRHQADVCHAYYILTLHGVPSENIILFSYDDAANSSMNPFPGKLFNKPGNNSLDVNAFCKKDYTGDLVTPENFLNVITGKAEKMNGGKVLNSTAKDHVFINFVDHGAPGLISFPNNYLFAHQLIEALEEMHFKNMYSKLVVYLEACESGSMFEGMLDKDLGVYSVTASNSNESSWGTYCPPYDKVNGVSLGTCLGDLFSVNWMQNTNSLGFNYESLGTQFEVVKNLTDLSHVSRFGNFSYLSDFVSDFIGKSQQAQELPHYFKNSVDSREIKLEYLYQLYKKNPTHSNAQNLIEEILTRQKENKVFSELNSKFKNHYLGNTSKVTNTVCLKAALEQYEEHCGKLSENGLKYIRVLANSCEANIPLGTIKQHIYTSCKQLSYK
mgnify:FL=1